MGRLRGREERGRELKRVNLCNCGGNHLSIGWPHWRPGLLKALALAARLRKLAQHHQRSTTDSDKWLAEPSNSHSPLQSWTWRLRQDAILQVDWFQRGCFMGFVHQRVVCWYGVAPRVHPGTRPRLCVCPLTSACKYRSPL